MRRRTATARARSAASARAGPPSRARASAGAPVYQPKLSFESEDGARVVLAKHGRGTYEPGFLAPAEAGVLLSELLGEVRWRQEHLRIGGREIPFPRLTAGDGGPRAGHTPSRD